MKIEILEQALHMASILKIIYQSCMNREDFEINQALEYMIEKENKIYEQIPVYEIEHYLDKMEELYPGISVDLGGYFLLESYFLPEHRVFSRLIHMKNKVHYYNETHLEKLDLDSAVAFVEDKAWALVFQNMCSLEDTQTPELLPILYNLRYSFREIEESYFNNYLSFCESEILYVRVTDDDFWKGINDEAFCFLKRVLACYELNNEENCLQTRRVLEFCTCLFSTMILQSERSEKTL